VSVSSFVVGNLGCNGSLRKGHVLAVLILITLLCFNGFHDSNRLL